MRVELGRAQGREPRRGRWASAARPTRVESRWMVIARSCSSRSRLLPTRMDVERVGRLVVLHDRTAVGAQRDVAEAAVGEPHGVSDDPVQDLVEVEARADRLAHLPERLQLRDLARQFGAPRLEGAQQVDLPERDRTLSGELLEELALVVVERRDLGAPHGQDADDLVLEDHRRGEKGAETGTSSEGPCVRIPRRPARRRSDWCTCLRPRARRWTSGSWRSDDPAGVRGTHRGCRGRPARRGTRRRREGTAGRRRAPHSRAA